MAHALARLGLGINIALHGLTRIGDLEGFAGSMKEMFAATFLPSGLVHLAAYAIAIGEAAIGILLALGLFLRWTLAAGMLMICLLLAGVCLLQNWTTAGAQMVYLGFYAALLATLDWDGWSLDRKLARSAR